MEKLITLICLLGNLSLFAQTPAAMSTGTYSFEGTVIDVDTEEPLANANIRFACTNGDHFVTTTNDSGYYQYTFVDSTFENRDNFLAFTIFVSKTNYLNSKGKEAIEPNLSPTRFIHDFGLQAQRNTCVNFFPEILYARDTIEPSHDSVLYLYQMMADNPTITLGIHGHTDKYESAKIADKRAKAVATLLTELGIESIRLFPKGFGNTRPIFSKADIAKLPNKEYQEAAYHKNRRVVFQVLGTEHVPAKNKPAPLKSAYLFTGLVRDEDTEEPIAGANLVVRSEIGSQSTTTTNEQGEYLFYLIEESFSKQDDPRIVNLFVSKPSYHNSKHKISLSDKSMMDAYKHDFNLGSITKHCSPPPNISFDHGKTSFNPDSLEPYLKILRDNPTLILEVSGHCTMHEKPAIAERRAINVRRALINKGIQPKRLIAKGYGNKQPIYTKKDMRKMNDIDKQTEAFRANRRVSFRVVSTDFVPKK